MIKKSHIWSNIFDTLTDFLLVWYFDDIVDELFRLCLKGEAGCCVNLNDEEEKRTIKRLISWFMQLYLLNVYQITIEWITICCPFWIVCIFPLSLNSKVPSHAEFSLTIKKFQSNKQIQPRVHKLHLNSVCTLNVIDLPVNTLVFTDWTKSTFAFNRLDFNLKVKTACAHCQCECAQIPFRPKTKLQYCEQMQFLRPEESLCGDLS